MKKNILYLILSSGLLAACGGSNQNSNSDTNGAGTDIVAGEVAADLKIADPEMADKVFDLLMAGSMYTGVLGDKDNYVMDATCCQYVGEDPSGAYVNDQSNGNYASMGCFQKKDGNILVVVYSLINHFNSRPLGEEFFHYYDYDPSTGKAQEIENPDFITVDSSDFMLDDPFIGFPGNAMLFSFTEDAIWVNFADPGFPSQRYEWDGERFGKTEIPRPNRKPPYFDYHYPKYFPAECFLSDYFDVKDNGDGYRKVSYKNGKPAANLHLTSDGKVDYVEVLSSRYYLAGMGPGLNIKNIENEEIRDGFDYSSESLQYTDQYPDIDLVINADPSSLYITSVAIRYKKVKSESESFSVANDSPLDETGREILRQIMSSYKLYEYRDVTLDTATVNSASFVYVTDGQWWDNSIYDDRSLLDFAYYRMDDGKYKAYLLNTFVEDGLDAANLRYTPKRRKEALAYIYDGSTIKQTECDLPQYKVEDIPQNPGDTYDPVCLYDFGEKSLDMLFYDGKSCEDFDDYGDYEEYEQGDNCAKVPFVWTGNGWQESPNGN